jgi:hypothetical protein
MTDTQDDLFTTHYEGIRQMNNEAREIQKLFGEITKYYNTYYIDISQEYVDKIDTILEKMFNDQHTIRMKEPGVECGNQRKSHMTKPIFQIHNTRDNSHRFVFHSCNHSDYKKFADKLIECFILSPETLEYPQSLQEHPNIEDIDTKFTPENKQFTIRFKTLLEPIDRCNLTENIAVTNQFPNYELKMINPNEDLFIEEMYKRMKSFIRKSKFSEYIELKYKQNIYVSAGTKRELRFELYKFTQQQELELLR